MKFRATLAAFSLLLAAQGIVSAEENLIQNGDFKSWSDGVPAAWTVGTSEGGSVTEITTAAGKGALVQNLAQIIQKISSGGKSFTVSFIFTVNQSPDSSEFSQSLSLHLYQTKNPAEFANAANAWLSLRLQSFNVGKLAFGLSVRNPDEWEKLTESVFLPSVLSDDNTALKEAHQYRLTLSYNEAKNTYSIAFGPVGGKTTTLEDLAVFRNPAGESGLTGIQFYSNHAGFVLNDVKVTETP